MNLASLLEIEEGRVRHAYQDHLGFWTIGIGRLIDKRKGGGLSNAEIDYLLQNDIREKTAELVRALPWFSDLDPVRKDTLVAMAFQMGTEGLLGFKNTLEMVRSGDYKAAGRGMMNSRWAQQTPIRAERMARQMESGLWVV